MLVILAVWMFLRSVNTNVFRTGSLILDRFYGDQLDIAMWEADPEGSYQATVQALTVIQSVFTLAIGLCILAVYSIFGLSKLHDTQSESLHDSSLLNSSQTNFSGLRIAQRVRELSPGKQSQIVLQRSLLIQMHHKDVSVIKNRSDKPSEALSF